MLSATQGFTYNKFEKPNDWPKLKDTFDYDIRDGKLLGGNKHLYLSGPVNYTKVGSPTIVDNVASNFSYTSYLKTSSQIDLSTTLDIEWYARFKTPSAVNNGNSTIFSTDVWDAPIVSVYGYSNTDMYITGFCGDLYASQLSADTYYRVKVVRLSADTWKGYLYSDDGTLLQEGAVNTRSISYTNKNIFIGAPFGSASPVIPEIDLNNTYIKVNGSLWFYGKNYTTKNMVPVPAGLEYNNTTTPSIGWVNTNTDRVKGPVTYTKVGSPTIVDGVASGFSNNDYIYTSSGFSSSYTNYEIVTRAKPNASSYALLTQSSGTSTDLKLFFSDRFFSLMPAGHSEGRFDISGSFDTNIFYYLKYIRNGNNITLAYSTDGITWAGQVTAVVTTWNTSNASLRFGVNPNYGDTFKGEIDLNSTYITVNGQPWFGYCPSEFQQFTPATKGTMIGKDDTHSLAVETYQDKGIVDYTVVGSPTITDGVASGFSSNDYLEFYYGTFPMQGVKIYEAFIKLTTGNDVSGFQGVFGSVAYNGPSFGLRIVAGYRWDCTLPYKKASDGTFGSAEIQMSKTIQANTTYYVKIKQDFEAGTSKLSVSTDNVNFTEETVTASDYGGADTGNWRLGVGKTQGSQVFLGSVDLNETYVKLDGNYWFHPYPNSYPKLVGPVNYTVIGNPNIVNGVVSGFSSSNYLQLSSPFNPSTATWELLFKVTTGTVGGTLQRIFHSKKSGNYYYTDRLGVSLGIVSAGHFNLAISSNGTSWNDNRGTYSVLADTDYWIKCTYDGSTYKLLYSLDGTTYIEDISFTDSNVIDLGQTILGAYWNYGTDGHTPGYFDYFLGSIDLNNTYIKVNNTLWFGKEDWTPSTYTDNAIYLLGSHKADYSNYNELSLTPSIETESDESGTYNVWIDNQKVIENKTGNTLIEWDKLALTTGYLITTPSALKAHPIKIEPTNSTDFIIAFNTEIIE